MIRRDDMIAKRNNNIPEMLPKTSLCWTFLILENRYRWVNSKRLCMTKGKTIYLKIHQPDFTYSHFNIFRSYLVHKKINMYKTVISKWISLSFRSNGKHSFYSIAFVVFFISFQIKVFWRKTVLILYSKVKIETRYVHENIIW